MYIIIAPAELPSKKSIYCHWDIWKFHLYEWWDSLSEYDAIFPKEIKKIRIQNKRSEQTLCFSDNAGGSWAVIEFWLPKFQTSRNNSPERITVQSELKKSN